MLTAQSIQNIREADIVYLIGTYPDIKLKPHGGNATGCCPFHNEKTPSFSVSSKGFYKCFGCGAGGDIIRFVMDYEHLDFIAACERIAAICNISLEYEQNVDKEEYNRRREEKKTLRDIMQEVYTAYRSLLWDTELGAAAMQYATAKRQYNANTLLEWGLGFAPDSYSFIKDKYSTNGQLPQLLQLGLVKQKENNGDTNYYDAYRGRLIIPVLDENGELVCLAGRIINPDDKKSPKYINGAVSPLYDKSKTLFGLYQAIPHIKKQGFAILTEGYFDVITMHCAGAGNTVGSCGTALTVEMARLLKRYTDRIVIMRDGDEAGLKATSKDIEKLLAAGFSVQVYTLPEGQDPDDYAKAFINEQTEQHAN